MMLKPPLITFWVCFPPAGQQEQLIAWYRLCLFTDHSATNTRKPYQPSPIGYRALPRLTTCILDPRVLQSRVGTANVHAAPLRLRHTEWAIKPLSLCCRGEVKVRPLYQDSSSRGEQHMRRVTCSAGIQHLVSQHRSHVKATLT